MRALRIRFYPLAYSNLRNSSVVRINVGCGQTPTPGWLNLDNSYSVLVAQYRALATILEWLGFLDEQQKAFIRIAREAGILHANALRLPVPDNSADVVYASHLLEHLDRDEAQRFLSEAYRVLVPGGIVRLVVPDLEKLVEEYVATRDADRLVERTLLAKERPKTLAAKVRWLLIGDRGHHWMYDGRSLSLALSRVGFRDVEVLPPGRTKIADPGPLNLCERADESVFVEGVK